MPTVEDIKHIIRVGVPSTSMPAWSHFLTPEQIDEVAKYLIVFSDSFTEAWKNHKSPEQLQVPTIPGDLKDLIPRGKEMFAIAQCSKCHGETGHGDGPSAADLKDVWDQSIQPTDLRYKWQFKNGYKPEDIYLTINAGFNGTPMPSYLDAFPGERDRWALVAYILSLSPAERPALHLADFKKGAATVAARLDKNGRVTK